MISTLAGMDVWKRRFFTLLGLMGVLIVAAVLLLAVFDAEDSGSGASQVADDGRDSLDPEPQSVSAYVEFEGRVLSIDRPSNTLRLQVAGSEQTLGSDRPTEVVAELPATFDLRGRLRLGSYVEVMGRYVPDENVLYVSRINFEDDDRWSQASRPAENRDYGEHEERETQQAEQVYEDYDEQEEWEQQQAEQVYEDYDEQEEWEQQQAEQVYEEEDDERERGAVSVYAEFEGLVVAVHTGNHSFRLRVFEAEYARGVQIPAEVTVELQESGTIPRWLAVGHYVEVEGRFVAEENILYASEIELEDD